MRYDSISFAEWAIAVGAFVGISTPLPVEFEE